MRIRDSIRMLSTGPGTETHSLSVCLCDEGMKVQPEETILPEARLHLLVKMRLYRVAVKSKDPGLLKLLLFPGSQLFSLETETTSP